MGAVAGQAGDGEALLVEHPGVPEVGDEQAAVAAAQAVQLIGMPEAQLTLAHATVHLATAPKSNAVYAAWNQVKDDIRDKPAEPVPLHIRNAPTGLMKELGYGEGYQYAHGVPEAYIPQEYLPERLRGVTPARGSKILPDVPPIAESGLPGFEGAAWLMIAAPAIWCAKESPASRDTLRSRRSRARYAPTFCSWRTQPA